jgi:ribonuclease HIII
MEPGDLAKQVERLLIKLFRAPVEERGLVGYQETLNAFYELLFEQQGLKTIGDLITLDRIEQILLQNGFEQHFSEELSLLSAHRAEMADIHIKLAQTLDRSLGIQDLLYLHLDRWPQLPEGTGQSFSVPIEQELQRIRLEAKKPSERLQTFFSRYLELLREAHAEDSLQAIQTALSAAINAYGLEEERATVHALFVDPNSSEGRCYPVKIAVVSGTGEEFPSNSVTEEMRMAARVAISCAFTLAQVPRHLSNVSWLIEEPAQFDGSSLGLALAIGVMSQLRHQPIDCYTAFTGMIAFENRQIGPIAYLPEKLQAAQKAGFQRVFLPQANLEEAHALAIDALALVGVQSLDEAWSQLTASATTSSPHAPSLEALIRHFELECMQSGLKVRDEGPMNDFRRLTVTDNKAVIPINVYQGQKGINPVVGGKKDIPLFARVNAIAVSVFGARSDPPVKQLRESYSVHDPAERIKVAEALRQIDGFEEKQEANCDYRLDFSDRGERVIVRQYTNGNLTVTQTAAGIIGAPLFTNLCRRIEAVLRVPPSEERTASQRGTEPLYEAPYPSGTLAPLAPAAYPFKTPWIGSDESGKGDYFGPLVSAAVYVDDQLLEQLAALGVKDSKLLSDKKAHELAQDIRVICKGRFAEKVMTPDEYNRHYTTFQSEGKTLNSLLAWAHYRVVEDLLAVVDCENIIVDQFAYEYHLRSRLFAKNPQRKLNLIQMPRAEANLAVAAASILARDRFLTWIEKLSLKYGTLPKGASAAVVQTARAIVARYGKEELRMIAKLHFKTTEQVLAP